LLINQAQVIFLILKFHTKIESELFTHQKLTLLFIIYRVTVKMWLPYVDIINKENKDGTDQDCFTSNDSLR
jgi:hypothetical protein